MKKFSTLLFISFIVLISSLKLKHPNHFYGILNPNRPRETRITRLTIIRKPIIEEIYYVPANKIDEVLPDHQEIQRQIQTAKGLENQPISQTPRSNQEEVTEQKTEVLQQFPDIFLRFPVFLQSL